MNSYIPILLKVTIYLNGYYVIQNYSSRLEAIKKIKDKAARYNAEGDYFKVIGAAVLGLFAFGMDLFWLFSIIINN